jgi:pyruvate dehydrogenase E2 component (dihydrolipoamide acetyltransferase)
MFGIASFSAVINPPQACILAVGAASTDNVPPIDGDDTVTTTTVVPMTSACDARIIDDATAVHFLATVREILENPELMLTHRAPLQFNVNKLFAK